MIKYLSTDLHESRTIQIYLDHSGLDQMDQNKVIVALSALVHIQCFGIVNCATRRALKGNTTTEQGPNAQKVLPHL